MISTLLCTVLTCTITMNEEWETRKRCTFSCIALQLRAERENQRHFLHITQEGSRRDKKGCQYTTHTEYASL